MRNNLRRRTLFWVLLILWPVFLFSQNRIIDSLKSRIRSLPDNHEKLSTIFFLYDHFNNAFPPDSLVFYASLAKTIAVKEKSERNITKCNIYLVSFLLRKGMLDSAGKMIEKNLAALTGNQNEEFRNKFLLLKSNILIRSNQQKESLKNSFEVLANAEELMDTDIQIKANLAIGWAYMELDQENAALEWLLKDYRLDKASNLKYTLAAVYNNIAAVYNDIHKNDSSIYYVKIAVEIAKSKNDLTALANAYNIYAGTEMDNKNIVHAEELLNMGLEIRKLIGDPFFIVSDMYELAVFYSNNHNPQKGIEMAKQGIAIAEKSRIPAKLPILYAALAENYKKLGDLKAYSEVLSKIIVLKDSLYAKNKADALSEMEAKYQVQKKENIIIQQQLDITKKNNLVYGTLALLGISILISYVIFHTRQKNQQLKMHQLLIEQKRNTMMAVLQAEENERKRIALELHDSVAQKMVVAKMNLEVLESELPALEPEQLHVYGNIVSLVDESCMEVRNLSHSMMPHAFFQSGLAEAVKNFIDKIENKNLHIEFSAEGPLDKLDKNSELMVYRVIQECLQNIIKHAQATKVDISIIGEGDEVDVTIEDNGVGFDTSQLDNAEGMGMRNIKSRIEFLNGKLDLNSSPGRGAVVAFFIPVKHL